MANPVSFRRETKTGAPTVKLTLVACASGDAIRTLVCTYIAPLAWCSKYPVRHGAERVFLHRTCTSLTTASCSCVKNGMAAMSMSDRRGTRKFDAGVRTLKSGGSRVRVGCRRSAGSLKPPYAGSDVRSAISDQRRVWTEKTTTKS